MRVRAIPHVGDTVTVVFLAVALRGVIERVDDDLRGLEVLTQEGEPIRFELSKATGRFMSEEQTGARLYFEDSNE